MLTFQDLPDFQNLSASSRVWKITALLTVKGGREMTRGGGTKKKKNMNERKRKSEKLFKKFQNQLIAKINCRRTFP